jgi:hypothetical protein
VKNSKNRQVELANLGSKIAKSVNRADIMDVIKDDIELTFVLSCMSNDLYLDCAFELLKTETLENSDGTL